MKNLKDIRTVAHHWANAVGDSGKASSLWFQGDTLYSYAEPIAKLLADGTVLHTTQKWSITTSAHQSLAHSATNHLRRVSVHRVQDTPAESMRYARALIAEAMAQTDQRSSDLKKDGTVSLRGLARIEKLKAEALGIADQANAYLAACQRNGLGVGEAPIDTTNLEGVRAELIRIAEEKRLKEVERQAEQAAELAVYVEAWRRGEDVQRSLYMAPVALRLGYRERYMDQPGMQVIETSHGAEIPVADAKRLWPLLLKVRAAGQTWTPSPDLRERRLGVYTLNTIHADGSVRVGCHEIAFAEMEKMAHRLDLTKEQA